MTFDRAELSSLYAAHRTDLVRLAALLLGEGRGDARGVADAEDAAHAAYSTALGRVRAIEDADEADALLRGEVVRLVRAAGEKTDGLPADPAAEPSDKPPVFSPSGRDLPDHHRATLAAIAALPHRQREVVVLREWAQLPDAEIAAALRLSTRSCGWPGRRRPPRSMSTPTAPAPRCGPART